MKVILAFDSFKGCVSALQACNAAREAILQKHPKAEIVSMPLSDGGEGLVQCLSSFMPLEKIVFKAHDPLMRPIEAVYAVSPQTKTAYMEMASTSGLTRISKAERNPLRTTTYGVGEMIADALSHGCEHLVIGIGGSATCDGGKGMLEALENAPGLMNMFGGDVDVTVVCDVNNPLYGPDGAAYVFGPQKGADETQVKILDMRLRQWAEETERRGIATPEDALASGSGAAGGLGYALRTYLKAQLKSGINVVLDILNFDEILLDADMVITGEGKSDMQTLMGKVPFGVLKRACNVHVPVVLMSGIIEDKETLLAAGFKEAVSINQDDLRPLSELLKPEIACENIKKSILRIL